MWEKKNEKEIARERERASGKMPKIFAGVENKIQFPPIEKRFSAESIHLHMKESEKESKRKKKRAKKENILMFEVC